MKVNWRHVRFYGVLSCLFCVISYPGSYYLRFHTPLGPLLLENPDDPFDDGPSWWSYDQQWRFYGPLIYQVEPRIDWLMKSKEDRGAIFLEQRYALSSDHMDLPKFLKRFESALSSSIESHDGRRYYFTVSKGDQHILGVYDKVENHEKLLKSLKEKFPSLLLPDQNPVRPWNRFRM